MSTRRSGTIGEGEAFARLREKGEMLDGTVESFNWELTCAINLTRVRTHALRRFRVMFLAVLAAYILLVVLITVMVNRQLHLLETLREKMIRIGENGSYSQIDQSGDRDVAYLFSGYNEMVRKVKQQETIILDQNRKNMEIAEKQRVAELKALELEINPHYLYNTLNTINAVAIEHGDYQVSRLLKGYSSTLVYMLRDRFQPVSVRQEVAWRVGIENDKYFHNVFKETVGVTPKRYRFAAMENSGRLPEDSGRPEKEAGTAPEEEQT